MDNELFRFLKNKTHQKLKEFYIKYDLNWIEDFVDELYSDNSPDIISELFPYIRFRFVYPDRHIQKLVLSASFNEESKSYSVVFNKSILDTDQDEFYKKDLKMELYQTLIHEDTHRQQSQNDPSKRKHINPNDPKISSTDYLSNEQEIDAFAREIGYWLESHNISINESFKKIETNTVDDKFYDLIYLYQEIGGPVYNKFLSEIYRYLVNEENYES